MKNLAGETKADLHILKELNEAGIEIIEGKRTRGEVPYTLTGKLANWNFSRAWYYWMADAKDGNGLPLDVATKLHNRTYPLKGEQEPKKYGHVIRVIGHAGCPPPGKWLNEHGKISYYHIDTQEGLNALAGAIRTLHNITSSGNDSKKILSLYDKISALYSEWETSDIQDGVEWLKKMPTILYGNGMTVNELIVAIKDGQEVVSIAKKWKDNKKGWSGITQHFFKGGQITGFNYGHISGPGQALNRGPEVDEILRPHYEEVKELRPNASDSLEQCIMELEKPGPEYTGKSDGSVSFKLK